MNDFCLCFNIHVIREFIDIILKDSYFFNLYINYIDEIEQKQ